MSNNNTDAILLADLVASNEEWKDGHSKATLIIVGATAILSTLSSSLLICIIARSRNRLSTTYHRLVLGMSISDIVYSSCFMTFGAMRPSDVSYMVWNARGNQATCDAMGFLFQASLTASLFYSCSLNLNYLAVVRYNRSEAYIRRRIEPYLHAIAVIFAIVFSVIPLVGKNYNGTGPGCQAAPVYEPPHCIGFEDGQVRDGFEIPCGRGRDGFPTFYSVSLFLAWFVPPVVIGISLGMMYQTVHNQENLIARYGAGSLNLNVPGAADGSAADEGGSARGGIGSTVSSSVTSLAASLNRRFGRRAATNPEGPAGRAVMQRAAAYSSSFFLTWSCTIVLYASVAARGGIPDPRPNWYLALYYLVAVFQPLQGLFNLAIYMQPRVASARKFGGRDLPWRRAIARAFRTSLGLERRDGDAPPGVGAGSGSGGGRS